MTEINSGNEIPNSVIDTDGKKVNLVKSYIEFAVDAIMPSLLDLHKPIEGVSTETRYHVRLWRIRLGHLFHGAMVIQGIINQDYIWGAANLGVLMGGALLVGRPLKCRRLKRMYLPFLNKH